MSVNKGGECGVHWTLSNLFSEAKALFENAVFVATQVCGGSFEGDPEVSFSDILWS